MALFKKGTKKESSPEAPEVSGEARSDQITGTLIAESLRIKGTITGDDPVVVRGRFEGNCDLNNDLEIGSTANIKGQFTARTITIDGKAEGELRAHTKAHLKKSAQVTGRLQAKKLSMLEGAVFDGELQMAAAPQPAADNKPSKK